MRVLNLNLLTDHHSGNKLKIFQDHVQYNLHKYAF